MNDFGIAIAWYAYKVCGAQLEVAGRTTLKLRLGSTGNSDLSARVDKDGQTVVQHAVRGTTVVETVLDFDKCAGFMLASVVGALHRRVRTSGAYSSPGAFEPQVPTTPTSADDAISFALVYVRSLLVIPMSTTRITGRSAVIVRVGDDVLWIDAGNVAFIMTSTRSAHPIRTAYVGVSAGEFRYNWARHGHENTVLICRGLAKMCIQIAQQRATPCV